MRKETKREKRQKEKRDKKRRKKDKEEEQRKGKGPNHRGGKHTTPSPIIDALIGHEEQNGIEKQEQKERQKTGHQPSYP